MEMSSDVGMQTGRSAPRPASRAKLWVVCAGVLLAIPLSVAAWSYRSPWFDLARLKQAALAGDEAALARVMDRKAIREKLVVKLSTDALRAGGMQPGDERVSQVVLAVESTVDELMKPENLSKLVEQARGSGDGLRVEGGYLNMGVFIFAIQNKATGGAVTLRMRRMGPSSWMLDELIFLTPRQLGAGPG